SAVNRAATLHKGDSVTVRGTVIGLLFNVQLNDCEIRQDNAPISSSVTTPIFRVGEKIRLPAKRQASTDEVRWVESMDAFLDSVATVTKIDRDKTVQLDVDKGAHWWAPEWLTPIRK